MTYDERYLRMAHAAVCHSKVRHASRTEARRAARAVQFKHGRQEPYRCRACSGYHIGHGWWQEKAA